MGAPTNDHLEELRRDGVTVVHGLFGPQEVAALQEAAAKTFPSVETVLANPTDPALGLDPVGLAYRTFPYKTGPLNLVPFNQDLLDFAQTAFEGQTPFLTQSMLRATYPLPNSADQKLHRDYTDNGLLYPSDDPAFESLAVLVYLTDVGPDNAPLFVVPEGYGQDRPGLPRERPPDLDPDLNAHEAPVLAEAGSVVLYTHNAWHRGSRYAGTTGWRVVMHVVLRPAGCEWLSFTAWGRFFEHRGAIACMEQLTPRQRTALGVPPPGHRYWTASTIAGVNARYPNMDMEPYRQLVR